PLFSYNEIVMAQRRCGSLLVVALLAVLLGAQTISFAGAHGHQHPSQHCCALCHAGPLPFLQSGFASALAPQPRVAWFSGTVESEIPHEAPLLSGSSRAPPHPIPFSV